MTSSLTAGDICHLPHVGVYRWAFCFSATSAHCHQALARRNHRRSTWSWQRSVRRYPITVPKAPPRPPSTTCGPSMGPCCGLLPVCPRRTLSPATAAMSGSRWNGSRPSEMLAFRSARPCSSLGASSRSTGLGHTPSMVSWGPWSTALPRRAAPGHGSRMPRASAALGGAPLCLVGVERCGAASPPECSMRIMPRRAWIQNLLEWVLLVLVFMGIGWLLAHIMVRGASQ
jgi:hypothetical protein